MDWKSLFLSTDGRIGRQNFWIGWAIIFGVNIVLGWIPLIGFLISIASIYCWVCVYAKRLHDMGKSGWLQLAPMLIAFVLPLIGLFAFGGLAIFAGLTHADDAAAGPVLAGLGGFLLTVMIAAIVGLGFLLWVGITPSDPNDNAYGPAGSGQAEIFT